MRFMLMATLFLFSSLAFAQTCDWTLPVNMERIAPDQTPLKAKVNVRFALENGMLLATFEVHNKTLNVKEKFGPNEYPFHFDVVEVFVSTSESKYPYYEFNLSPLNQTFTARI